MSRTDLLLLDGEPPERLVVVDTTPEGHATPLFAIQADYGWAETTLFDGAYEHVARDVATALSETLGVPVEG